MAEQLDCVVVGAGIVGLAIARSLALAGRKVIVLEAESRIGMHTSSRNSEVIHAGIYYPEDSLKARLCVEGKERLYAYCKEHRVGFEQLGKLIVAPGDADLERLMAIKDQAARSGVTDLTFVNTDEMVGLEPEVVGAGALLSPSTGIIDSHELLMALQADIEAQSGVVVCDSEVTNLDVEGQGIRFESAGEAFVCKTLINSAGLRAQELVSGIGTNRAHGALLRRGDVGAPRGRDRGAPELHFAKGHYFAYQGKSPFRHLVYPLPTDDGLGIHATNDLSGAARFGPDVVWVDAINYDFDESRKTDFVAAIRSYYPSLDEDKLVPAYTGIRPKLSGPGEPTVDFKIMGESDHGIPGLVNLFGIESPGLTASLAIGEFVVSLLGGGSTVIKQS